MQTPDVRPIPEYLWEDATPVMKRGNVEVWQGADVEDAAGKVEWLLEGAIQKGGYTAIYGPSGSGKSLIAMDWACTLATEGYGTWEGVFTKKQKQVKVLYLAGEGTRGISNRVRAWMNKKGLDVYDDSLFPPVGWIKDRMSLWRPPSDKDFTEDQYSLIDVVKDGGYEVLFVDTLAQAYGGGDENRQQDMNMFLQTTDEITDLGCGVVLLHHSPKDGKDLRGSNVLRGHVDTVFKTEFEQEGTAYVRGTLTGDKQKDGFQMRNKIHLIPVEWESGDGNRDNTSLALTVNRSVSPGTDVDFLLDVIEQNPELSSTKLWDWPGMYAQFNSQKDKFTKFLADLESRGKIKNVSGNKFTKWIVVPDAEEVEGL